MTVTEPSPEADRQRLDGVADADSSEAHGEQVLTYRGLFDREYTPMVRLAFLMLGSNEAAEDTVQEAFARLHSRWDRVDNPGGYLRISVVNGCRSALRRRRVQQRREAELRPPVEVTTHDVEASSVMEADEVFDALARLSTKQRAAVVLRFYVDLPETEIASILGVRPGTVKSLLSRGLSQLRKVIEP